jgi:hypothetical protein
MAFLDQILSRVLGQQQPSAGTSPSGIGNVLTQLLGGQSSQNQGGGIAGLIQQFRGAGFGHVADSWVSKGPNQPVSPQQLQTVFGDNQVQMPLRKNIFLGNEGNSSSRSFAANSTSETQAKYEMAKLDHGLAPNSRGSSNSQNCF